MVGFDFDWYNGYRTSWQYIDFSYRVFARWWMKCGPVAAITTAPNKPRSNATIPKVTESLESAFRTYPSSESAEHVTITILRIATALIVAWIIYCVLLKLHNSLAAFINARDDSDFDFGGALSGIGDPDALPVHNPNRKSSRTVRRAVSMSKPVPVSCLMTRDHVVKSDPKETKRLKKSGSPTQISDPSGSRVSAFPSDEDLCSEMHRLWKSAKSPLSDSVHCSPRFTEVTEKTQRVTGSPFSPPGSVTILPNSSGSLSLRSSSMSTSSSGTTSDVHSAISPKSDDVTQRSERSSADESAPTQSLSTLSDERMKGGASVRESSEFVLKTDSPKTPSQAPIGILQMFPNSSMQAGCSECQMKKLYPTLFKWHDSSAQSVFVSGSFLNWESKIALFKEPKDAGWSVEVKLPRGHYEFKFIVDKRWAVDHKRQPTIRDKEGDWNNVVHV